MFGLPWETLLPIAAVAAVIAVSWLFNKNPSIKKYEGLMLEAFNAAEKMGKKNKKLDKAAKFMELFLAKYEEKTGAVPSGNLMGEVLKHVEKMVFVQNLTKGVK